MEYKYNFRISKWGVWSQKFGLEIFPAEKWELRKDLSEIYFEATTGGLAPFVLIFPVVEDSLPPGYVWKKETPHKLVNVGGYIGDIWASLQQMTNFSYTMVKR